MRILRAVFIVLVAFAATALYIQGQWVYHNREQGLWEAIRMVVTDNLIVTIPALVIIAGFIVLAWYYQRKEDKKNEAMIKMLRAIAKKLGVDADEPQNKKPKRK